MSLTARQAVTRAIKELNYYPEGEDPTAGAISDGLDALNSMLAAWQTSNVLLAYPSFTTWRGEWEVGTSYAVGDGVTNNGSTYVCAVQHTATSFDEPNTTPNWATYWTYYAENVLPLTLDVAIPIKNVHERGLIALLAVDIAPIFSVQPSQVTVAKADAGWRAILADYNQAPTAQHDPALIYVPSRRWPYSVPSSEVT